MLVQRIWYWINYLQTDSFLYSHNMSDWYCVDIVRRNSVLKSLMGVKGSIFHESNTPLLLSVYRRNDPHGKLGKHSISVLRSFNSHEWPRQNFSSQNSLHIKYTSDENEEKDNLGEHLVYPIPNSPSQHHKNCMVDSRKNYWWDLGGKQTFMVFSQHPAWDITSVNRYKMRSVV